MRLFNRIFDLQSAEKILMGHDYTFLYAGLEGNKDKERRGYVCKEYLRPKEYIEVQYKVSGISQEGKIEDGFEVFLTDCSHRTYNSLEENQMFEFVQTIHMKCRCLVIDFTLMNIRFLGAMLSQLYKMEWDNVLFCYTEPKAYIKDGKCLRNIKFDMKNTMLGCEEIPGLETESDREEKLNWVTFLGFESGRLGRLEQEVSGNRENIIPVICIPSMHVEWHNYAIDVHREFLDKLKDRDKISYVSATNPFDVYNYLCKERDDHNRRMVVTPISTKPVILGTLMYILENPQDMLLWDSPYQTQPNSEDSGRTLFFDISYYIRQIKDIKTKTQEVEDGIVKIMGARSG